MGHEKKSCSKYCSELLWIWSIEYKSKNVIYDAILHWNKRTFKKKISNLSFQVFIAGNYNYSILTTQGRIFITMKLYTRIYKDQLIKNILYLFSIIFQLMKTEYIIVIISFPSVTTQYFSCLELKIAYNSFFCALISIWNNRPHILGPKNLISKTIYAGNLFVFHLDIWITHFFFHLFKTTKMPCISVISSVNLLLTKFKFLLMSQKLTWPKEVWNNKDFCFLYKATTWKSKWFSI